MNTPLVHPALVVGVDPRAVWREAVAREPWLAWFAFAMVALMAPTLVAMGLDDRLIRGVSVWTKPLKFMASLALFSISTAWFIGLLPAAERRGRGVRALVAVIVAAGLFEIGYIVLQAALGQASHYNLSDRLHMTLYSLMGGGALAMTATQAWLAWRIARAPASGVDPAWRQGVITGLAFTFLLGAGAGGLLGGLQPPAGAGLPIVGWHLAGDLRPAHFIGMHAQQFLPLAALFLRGRALTTFSVGYALLWALALAAGLAGAAPTPLPPYDGMNR